MLMASLASLVAPAARASIRTPVTSISDAKTLVSALDIYLELAPGRESEGDPIDREKMAQGLADGISRLQPEQFNGLTQKLVGDYLREPERRRGIEGFIELLSASVEKEYRGKVSGLGASAAEDALIMMAMLGTLHATPYAVDLTLKTGGQVAKRIAATEVFRRSFKGWSESRIWKGATLVPKLAWDVLVRIPSKVLVGFARPVSKHWVPVYSAAAAFGVGHSALELYQTSRMNPRQILTLAQLRVIAGFDARLAELARKAQAPSQVESEDVFGGSRSASDEAHASELATMESELKQLLESTSEGVSGAARKVLDRMAGEGHVAAEGVSPPA
jgi:hypothetical protein